MFNCCIKIVLKGGFGGPPQKIFTELGKNKEIPGITRRVE